MALAAAHERWFVPDDGLPTRWGDIARPDTLVILGIVLAVVAATLLLWRARNGREALPGPLALGASPDRLRVVLAWVPLLLATHTAVPLLVGGIQGQVFVPNLQLTLPASAFLGLAQIGIALLLFYGLFARWAALGLAAVWLAGVAFFGPVLMLEQVVFLGIAAFFWIAGRGPIAIDRMWPAWAEPRERLLPFAIPALRVATGLGIAWLALTEKLLNVPLALSFIAAYPFANVLAGVGLPVSDAAFVRVAGGVELLAGLLLVTGAFPRLVVLVLWLPFNLTLAAFGWRELVGHLPIYAVMAIVLLWGRGGGSDRAALRAALLPGRARPAPALGTEAP